MDKLTNNLKCFSVLASIFSVTFFYLLYSSLLVDHSDHIWLYASFYGLALSLSGLAFGYNDSVRESRLDLGFAYHLMTFIIVNSIGLGALLIAMGLNIQVLLSGILSIALWGIGLLVHYYYSVRSIKGMDRVEIFD